MILRLKRTPGIYLVGFMGSGKSTIGRILANEIGWSFIDLDEEIERASGMTIGTLFESKGEPAFRDIEHNTLRCVVQRVEQGQPVVIALGGGAFAQSRNVDLLENNGVTIWLDCPLDVVEKRVGRTEHRPLARNLKRLRQLFRDRMASYQQADYRIEVNDADPSTHVASILRLPLFQ